MKRGAVAVAVSILMVAPLAPPAFAGESAAAPVVAAPAAPAVAAAKKIKNVQLSAGRKKVHINGTVVLNGVVKPKGVNHVAFEQQFPGESKWVGAGAKLTKKNGAVSQRVQLEEKGAYEFRLVTKNKNSKSVEVQATGKNPPVPPIPPKPPTSMAVNWPDGNPLEVDAQYPLPVQVKPAGNVQVRLQQKDSGGWSDVYGGTANTGKDGQVDLIMSIPDTGASDFRVQVAQVGLTSQTVSKSFYDGGDTLYNIPMKLPNDTGVIVKAQDFPMTYPKLPAMKNPLNGNPLILPSAIGGPDYPAGPPACSADPAIARKDCGIPGKQYRIMYTTERWYPKSDGTGTVRGGTQGATALLLLPGTTPGQVGGYNPNKVFVWAHPTLGQADKCSISRGTSDIPSVNGATGAVSTGPGGMDVNITDMLFFLDQMLRDGWTVVMPDYLGIAVNGPTGNQKSYVVGPQEARDIFFAADSLQSPADNGHGWPGMPKKPAQQFVVAGHSQGGHAALWAGIKANELKQQTGQTLLGVSAIAPATDMNMLVTSQWDRQANWIIGPEVIQTWAGYLPSFAFNNITISDAAIQNLARYENYCTTQAYAASYEFFPGGLQSDGVAFMKDPNNPDNQKTFYNWASVFGAQTPAAKPNDFSTDQFPKDLPLQLISGTADQVTLSQINAAFQENFCSAVKTMNVYWTPVQTGAVNGNPPATDALQAADHLNPLTFPWTNFMGQINESDQHELAGGTLRRFLNAPSQAAGNCGTYQAPHTAATPKYPYNVDTWYVFPAGTNPNAAGFYQTGGSPLLPHPADVALEGGTINPPPPLGTVNASDLKNITQTGCGLQYEYYDVPDARIWKVQARTNTACYQWGMFPYGQSGSDKPALLYSDAGAAAGGTWGGPNGRGYPYIPPKP